MVRVVTLIDCASANPAFRTVTTPFPPDHHEALSPYHVVNVITIRDLQTQEKVQLAALPSWIVSAAGLMGDGRAIAPSIIVKTACLLRSESFACLDFCYC